MQLLLEKGADPNAKNIVCYFFILGREREKERERERKRRVNERKRLLLTTTTNLLLFLSSFFVGNGDLGCLCFSFSFWKGEIFRDLRLQ